ncbi:MAG: hypothetical protein GIX03_00630 [Candidatus Eremiobacteraeota bacterium]|nr:hypothetical protein [Candidatus Eremiobacteraeota bacterium]MBC5801528.1 hypothetical protein [Candidatus Eremiobacteraeota bacterium]MBC5821079.1 hypothetical protein [Candidatus Eremiobacteraeota bacterium]
MSEFDILRSAAAGMDAQRAALDVAARNVAAAQATPDRGGFERLVPRYAVAAQSSPDPGPGDYEPPDDPDDRMDHVDPATSESDRPVSYLGTRVEHGGDVDAVSEMVAVLDAQRAYESNASVFDIGKRLAERTIDVGRLG